MSAMRCPGCQHKYTHVEDTRPRGGLVPALWRRRSCAACGGIFHTYEVHADSMAILVDIEKENAQ